MKRSGKRGIAWALGAALGLGMAVAAPQVALAAEDTALLQITKSASETTLKPGETMEYTIDLSCSTISDLGCRGATLSDLIPAEFEIVEGGVSVMNATTNPPTIEGNQVTVEFIDPLGDGTVGLLDNVEVIVTIQVKLRDDLPFEANGKPIVNTAVADAENAAEASDLVEVTPVIDLKLLTEVDKSYDPASGVAKPGTTTKLTVNGSNKSNAGVDTLTLTDPTDPTASPNPFDLLEIATLDSLTFPNGARDEATVEYFIDGEWVSEVLSASAMPHAPPGDAKGIRVTFTAADGSKIPTGAGGGFVLGLKQRPGVAELADKTTVKNTVESEVALDDKAATADDSADYTIFTDNPTVEAEKSFDPSELTLGQETTVTLSGTNTSAIPLNNLKIREPATGAFAPELGFVGFTSKVQYPTGATGGTLTLVYLTGDGVEKTFGPVSLANGAAFPELPDDFGSLKHFEIDFAGPIEPGSSSTIEFNAVATDAAFDPVTGEAVPAVKNVVAVEGETDTKKVDDTASDTVSFSKKQLEIVTEKKLSPGAIWGYPGEGVLVQLPTTVVKPGSNVSANEIIVSDPVDPTSPESSAFWDKFTPQAVTNTDVPEGATLTVRYWDKDSSAWVTVPGFEGLTGTVNKQLPADILEKIGGLQFVFESPDPGFNPRELDGKPNVNPSFTATLNDKYEGSDPLNLENCATSSGAAQSGDETIAEDVSDAPACDSITVNAPTPGEYDLFDKNWVGSGDPAQIVQRSGDHATTELRWSTANLTFEQMTIGDTRLGKTPGAGPADPVENTTFEAFNLVKIKAVTNDAAFTAGWDMITSVDLWINGEWKPATNARDLPYTKKMDDIALTSGERRDATAVRIVFAENPEGRSGADAPAPGSGLTKTASTNRLINLEWELRDVRRSNPSSAVIASEIFNVDGEEGLVKNRGSATGEQPGGGVEYSQDSDDIIIVPRPLGVTVSKGWSGGPLGVPPVDVPASSYPTSRVTISATNTSQQKVDQLSITDPSQGGEDPFEIFSLYKIVSAPHPVTGGDANRTLVVLTKADGNVIDPNGIGGVTPGVATAMTPAELADVVKIELRHEGRIATKATATLAMDLQLRKTHRSDPNKPVTVAGPPVKNGASASVTDLLGLEQEYSVESTDDAQIRLDTFELGVQTTKKFVPEHQKVLWAPGTPQHTAEEWSAIRMDLTARPTGTARTDKLVVTDSAENRTEGTASAKSFWNAYRFIGFTDDTLAVPAPANQVQAEVLYGDFESGLPANKLNFAADKTTASGTGWVPGTADAVEVTDGKIDNAAATLLSEILPADYDRIRGIRLSYTRVDAAGEPMAFENPANPEAKISLDVKRRAYLVSDPAVAVPSSDAAASAPGEPVQAPGGQFHNTVDAQAESFVKVPVAESDVPRPLVAKAEATARVTYLAEGIEVAVEKTPAGAQTPGKVIPFQLKTTNTSIRQDPATGASANIENRIPNLVIRDMFPKANGKPQLVFDPDMDPAKRFSFELSNAYEQGRFPVPVDPSKITVVYLDENQNELTGDGEPFGVEFQFPRSSEEELASDLYPEESYTVTVNMMFRPGVLAGADNKLSNAFEVQSANPGVQFDGCNFQTGHPTKSCGTTTEVYPTEAGALRGKKYVRANDTQLGVADVPNPNAGLPHVPNFGDEETGYYAGNSVPITKPLGVETWREELQNTGTMKMDKVVTIDTLPHVGDQGALVLMPRSSEWRPTWVGNLSVVADTAPDGTKYRTDVTPKVYYSSAEGAVCSADLKPTEQQCDEGYWKALDDSVDPETVRHVKTVFEFGDDNLLLPGERLAYTFKTRTPAEAPKMTANTVAWNSVAVGAQTVGTDEAQTPASVLPSEGLRVGVALATGPLSVQKTVTGPGAEFAPKEFEVQVQCVVPPREGSEGGPHQLEPIHLTLTAGEVVTLEEQLPWGATCELVEESGVHGETSSTSHGVEIASDTEPTALATLENRYELGSFTVVKQVKGAENQDGKAIDYGAFPVAAECSFLGEQISLDPATAELTHGPDGAWSVDELPVGAKCSLEELDAKGGKASLEINGVTQDGTGPWEFEIQAGSKPVELVLTNDMPLVSIEITKELAGAGAAAVSDDTVFTFAVECVLGDQPVFDGTIDITKAEATEGSIKRIEHLPAGAECGVTETGTGGATSTTITPDTSDEKVTVDAENSPVRFTAVNTFDAGSLHVTKEITGAGAELWGVGPFTVSLACTTAGAEGAAGNPVAVPGGADRELSEENGYEASYEQLPVGAECELTETVTGGATSSEIVDAAGEPVANPVVIPGGDALALRVINTFDVGSIEVTKEITGAGAELWGVGPFTVNLACTTAGSEGAAGNPVAIPGGADRELTEENGYEASYEQLPVGAKCELTETETGGATSSEVVDAAGAPVANPVVITAGDELALRVINTFDVGSIEVTKEITGAGASLAEDSIFTVELACLVERDGAEIDIDIPGGAERELSQQGGLTATYEQLPVGAECELRETGTGGGKTVSITPNKGEATVGAVTVAAGAAAELTVVNEFPAVPTEPGNPDPGTPGKPGTPGTPGISETGGGLPVGLIGGGIALLLLGTALVVLRVRRSSAGN